LSFHYHQGSYYINPCYHAWHAFCFSLTILPHDLWLGYFFFPRDLSFMSLTDSPLFVKFSKVSNFNFRESWFGFFLFSEIPDQICSIVPGYSLVHTQYVLWYRAFFWSTLNMFYSTEL
jgi:hypothetical protein